MKSEVKLDLEDWSDEDKKNCDCENLKESKKTVLTLTETEVIDLIEKIIQEDKEGISDQTKSMKQSQRDNESYYKEVGKKLKDYNKGYQDEGKQCLRLVVKSKRWIKYMNQMKRLKSIKKISNMDLD